MGRSSAEALGGALDVVLVHKLGSPWSAELAIGAIDEGGWTYIAEYARAGPARGACGMRTAVAAARASGREAE